MKILVTNPTGKIGRRILAELLAPEFSVRVIARDPARLPQDIREQVQVVRGSTDNAETLQSALGGVEALFWCVPTESIREMNVRAYYERFAHTGAQAIRKAGTPRVVTISAIGKGLAHNAGPISGLHAMEDILNESGAAIRHVRCGWFMENLLGQTQAIAEAGIVSYPLPAHIGLPMAAVTDIADVALRLLVRRDWLDIKAIPVHGPEDVSWAKAVATFAEVLKRPVRYREISSDDYIRKLVRSGASLHYAQRQAAMFSNLAQGIARAEPRTPESSTPTTLAAWAQSELLPLFELLRRQSERPVPGVKSLDAVFGSNGYQEAGKSIEHNAWS